MRKKQLLLLTLALVMLPLTVGAQSSDAAYPMGEWQTSTMNENITPKYFVSLSVDRETVPDENFDNRHGCGMIYILNYKTDEELFRGQLTYAGKEIKNDMGTGSYIFNVRSDKGTTCTINVNGRREPMIIGTGELKDHPAFNEMMTLCPGLMMGTGGEVYDMYSESEKEFLDNLRNALTDRRSHTVGFGNLRQYINAHAKLNPTKVKYAKPKAKATVTIRKTAKANGESLGQLKPGQTLPVVDEYNGWCQVRLGESTFGWVPLSAVTLTNVQGTAAVIK